MPNPNEREQAKQEREQRKDENAQGRAEDKAQREQEREQRKQERPDDPDPGDAHVDNTLPEPPHPDRDLP